MKTKLFFILCAILPMGVVMAETPIATISQDCSKNGITRRIGNGTENGHDYVDLGLPSGVVWATCNVGATTPEGYGDYFAWGETSPKTTYDWSTYKYCQGSKNTMTKYCTDSNYGIVDNKTTLDLEDDAAHVNWGGAWQIPTKEQFEELTTMCEFETTDNYNETGVGGMIVTSSINGNSIFLPFASSIYNSSIEGSDIGYYWSLSLDREVTYTAWCLNTTYINFSNDEWRYAGRSVRPVLPKLATCYLSLYANGCDSANIYACATGQEVKIYAEPSSNDCVFLQWNDGNTDNPRTMIVTNDTTLTAMFSDVHNVHEYVDLGLSVLWATCNVGATTPEDYGDYFAWGETSPKTAYDWSTYKYCQGSETTLTKYCTDSNYGIVDNKTTLDSEDDAAYVNWGGNWRMPTYNELYELRTQCTWTWTTLNNINGYEVVGPNGNSIFVPEAGYYIDNNLNLVGKDAHFWSSTFELYEASHTSSFYHIYCAGRLGYASHSISWGYDARYYGNNIRPVFEKSTSTGLQTLPYEGMEKKEVTKFIHEGQLYILRDGKIFNAQGALMQ